MIADGWNGKSVKEHIEAAEAAAEDARGLAESAHDEIADLRAEMAELAARCKACKGSTDRGQA